LRDVQAEGECRSLERALTVQAEAMLAQQQQLDEFKVRTKHLGLALPSLELPQPHTPQATQRRGRDVDEASPRKGSRTPRQIERQGRVGEGGVAVPHRSSERNLCAELASRLEALLGENAAVRARVDFLEAEVRDLNDDLDRRRNLLGHLLMRPDGGRLFRAAFRGPDGHLQGPAAGLEATPEDLDAKVKAMVSAVRSLGGGGGEDLPMSPAAKLLRLSPEQSLVELTLRENLELKQRLARLEPVRSEERHLAWRTDSLTHTCPSLLLLLSSRKPSSPKRQPRGPRTTPRRKSAGPLPLAGALRRRAPFRRRT